MSTVTPPILGDEDLEPRDKDRPREIETASNSLGVWAIRILSALVIPAVLIVIFFSFGFLKDQNANKGLQVIVAILVGTIGVWGLYWGSDKLISMLPSRAAAGVRPFMFVGPAMVLLGFYLVYPAINTIYLSFQDADSENWVGFDNFETILTESYYLTGIRNSIAWVLLVPAAAVSIGLAFAVMADKMSRRTESAAKSVIFMPMAISFVGASVVWAFVYYYRAEGFGEQIGLLNAIWTSWFNGEPVQWLSEQPWNNLFLMVILVWLQVGFAMVILSSAIKGVPDELLEAARIDGATEWQVFWRIVLPSISSTVVVVWTTVVITVWKVFDIVWVMTGGNFDTQVIAQMMVLEFFDRDNNGVGAALAVLLFVAVLPILVINVRRFRAQEAIR
jgi:alpha-glucoside transport system permease protein